jgi:hypothetical protein
MPQITLPCFARSDKEAEKRCPMYTFLHSNTFRLPTLVTYEDLRAAIGKRAAGSFKQRRGTDEVAELMVSVGIFTNEIHRPTGIPRLTPVREGNPFYLTNNGVITSRQLTREMTLSTSVYSCLAH